MGWEKIIGPCILALLLTNALMASDPVPERWLSVHTSAARVTNSARVTARVHAFSHGIPELARSGFALSSMAEIHIRGASSRTFAKISYALELQDDDGEDLKVPLFDLPEESDWVLYASYSDKTFIRDALAYDLWRAMGHYGPRTTYVDLLFLGDQKPNDGVYESSTDGYHGLYVLVEKIKRSKHRLNTQKVGKSSSPASSIQDQASTSPSVSSASSGSNDPLSGGYVFKKDRLGPDEVGAFDQWAERAHGVTS